MQITNRNHNQIARFGALLLAQKLAKAFVAKEAVSDSKFPEGQRRTNQGAPTGYPLRRAIFPRDTGKTAILKRIPGKTCLKMAIFLVSRGKIGRRGG